MRIVRLAATAVLGGGLALVPVAGTTAHADPGSASTSLESYTVAAQAPVSQVTQDDPTATFHPQGEGEFTYAESDMDTSHSHALADVVWPGSAGGNVGSLLGVLGYNGFGFLNDPVRAEVSNGTGTNQATQAEGPATMTASVNVPTGDTQAATAETDMGPGGGPASGVAKTTTTLGSDGTLSATASTTTTHFDIGPIAIGSFVTTASEKSVNAGSPVLSTTIGASNFTVGGQPMCVDGAGVHAGDCGKGAPPAVQDVINQVLSGAGMHIYFTGAHTAQIGTAIYQYAASMLIYWQPTGDSNHDTFTVSLGGAAVGMQVTPGGPAPALPTTPVVSGGSSGGSSAPVVPSSSGGGSLSIPADTGTSTLQQPTTGSGPSSLPSSTPVVHQSSGPPTQQLALGHTAPASTKTGIPGGWFFLLVLAAIAGAVGLPRLPALLRSAAVAECPNSRRS